MCSTRSNTVAADFPVKGNLIKLDAINKIQHEFYCAQQQPLLRAELWDLNHNKGESRSFSLLAISDGNENLFICFRSSESSCILALPFYNRLPRNATRRKVKRVGVGSKLLIKTNIQLSRDSRWLHRNVMEAAQTWCSHSGVVHFSVNTVLSGVESAAHSFDAKATDSSYVLTV